MLGASAGKSELASLQLQILDQEAVSVMIPGSGKPAQTTSNAPAAGMPPLETGLPD